jgi:hypothetical protein
LVMVILPGILQRIMPPKLVFGKALGLP